MFVVRALAFREVCFLMILFYLSCASFATKVCFNFQFLTNKFRLSRNYYLVLSQSVSCRLLLYFVRLVLVCHYFAQLCKAPFLFSMCCHCMHFHLFFVMILVGKSMGQLVGSLFG